MGGTSDAGHPSHRADARRNRQRLIEAAIELILEIGGEPSRDAVAHRAGVGIATLYRHFPERQALLRAVLLDVLDRAIDRGEVALADSITGAEALRRYMHDAIDCGLGVVNVIHALLDTTDWPDRRVAAQRVLDRLVEVARVDSAIGADVSATTIALATIRFCRPLAIGLDPADERLIAHQQLDSYLVGLATSAGQPYDPSPAGRHSASAALQLDAKGPTGTTGDSFTTADGRGP